MLSVERIKEKKRRKKKEARERKLPKEREKRFGVTKLCLLYVLTQRSSIQLLFGA